MEQISTGISYFRHKMKLIFNHSFGSMKSGWLQFSAITAEINEDEEPESINAGWLRDCNSGIWYQSRSTRINCAAFSKIRSWPKGYTFEIKNPQDPSFPIDDLTRVYQTYIKHRNYTDSFSPLIQLNKTTFGVVRNKDGIIVAFTKFQHYNGGMESVMFCWDYSEPKISLGLAIQAKEIEYAMTLGLTHLYIGAGYETTCLYKANFPGFEWWTGSEWSTDADAFKTICVRDTKIWSIIPTGALDELYELEGE